MSLKSLIILAKLLLGLLLVKVFVTILLEYRFYFPPNFDSAFLTGRGAAFVGPYRYAFYLHIVASPVVLVLGTLLMWSGGQRRLRRLHRVAGKVQFLLIVAVVVPSGLLLAPAAFTGPVAAVGFIGLSLATLFTALAAVWSARSARFAEHRRWATRCYLLLLSPLLLRVAGGTFIVLSIESELTYRLNAWLSWLVPLAVYEWLCFTSARQKQATLKSVTPRGELGSSVVKGLSP